MDLSFIQYYVESNLQKRKEYTERNIQGKGEERNSMDERWSIWYCVIHERSEL